ncbi:MAG: HEPN domain-containing protein [Proteobacteria bacterium]|nr:HEPN domain-containing protein [Pseudomonadota bacterium]
MTDPKNIVDQWVARADYDLSAAAAMEASGHSLYVAFMSQQAAEKILKAIWCKLRDDSPPYVHNLSTLVESLKIELSDGQHLLMNRLSRYYIAGRYPSFKQKLASELSRAQASELLSQTEDFVKWCRKSILMLNE